MGGLMKCLIPAHFTLTERSRGEEPTSDAPLEEGMPGGSLRRIGHQFPRLGEGEGGGASDW